MLLELGKYLKSKGYKNICADYMPDVNEQLEVIYIGKWGDTPGKVADAVHYIQIQVRRKTYEAAFSVCNELYKLLDSNREDDIETVIQLTGDVFCIAIPRRGPVIMERGSNYATFYSELALYGPN